MRIAILNAGGQTDYLFGLVSGLARVPGLHVDAVDADSSAGLFDRMPSVTFYNLRGGQRPSDPFLRKAFGILRYYLRLIRFAATSPAEVFHVQWENSFIVLDRTLLLWFYKALGKKIVWTAHNVDRDDRDERRSRLRAWSLRRLYHSVHAIIVHTDRMKEELCRRFDVPLGRVEVITHGMNNLVPVSGIARQAARQSLGIPLERKVLLFFGYLDHYKGVDLLIEAFAGIARRDPSLLLMINGSAKRNDDYLPSLTRRIDEAGLTGQVRLDLRFIPPEEVEPSFVAADCLVLPYRRIFQSGVVFLAFRFGLPIIATDVGNFREDIGEGVNGFVARENTPAGLAEAIDRFFASPLYLDAAVHRERIRREAERRFDWTAIAERTVAVYDRVCAPESRHQ